MNEEYFVALAERLRRQATVLRGTNMPYSGDMLAEAAVAVDVLLKGVQTLGQRVYPGPIYERVREGDFRHSLAHTDSPVEALARQLCERAGASPDAVLTIDDNPIHPMWRCWVREAEEILGMANEPV